MNTYEPRVVGDQFALLVAGVVDYAIFMLDPTGTIVTWNEGAQRIKGYTADEVIGRHFSMFYPPDEVRNESHPPSCVPMAERSSSSLMCSLPRKRICRTSTLACSSSLK